jgi:hypothetical protein
MPLYGLTIFLSAFLLFEVQPVIAKMILPWFGGTSAVWSTCMLFFQVVLLLGYAYAHWLHRTFDARKQAMIHGAALLVSLATLPILPSEHWKMASTTQPSFRILALLALTIGLPYFLLSATSPLLQAWFARNYKEGLPYRLFALSNFASLLALLSYPVLVEPNLPNRLQAWTWSGAYVAFATVCGLTAWRASLHSNAGEKSRTESPGAADAPSWTLRLLWLGLAASASILLLAITTHLTQDVAPIPFLWILPLTVYLLTFIFCFEMPRVYRRPMFLPAFAMALAFMAFRLWPEHTAVKFPIVHIFATLGSTGIIACFAIALFVSCMVCHGELARLKPDPRYLTGFYVIISLGGAIGGLFVGLVAPNLFRAYYEFPVGLGVCALVVSLVLFRALWPLATPPRAASAAGLLALLCVYLLSLTSVSRETVEGYRLVARNFYGLLRVADEGNPAVDDDASRRLMHGLINHGQQMLRDEYRREPVTYFCPMSGIGRAMTALEGRGPRRIGILGLGCGTLAAYGRRGDTLRIYEINSLVLDIARHDFTYLSDSQAKVEVAMGDGRLVLEAEKPQGFDILVMDAFSGDAVPVHLLTEEAFELYRRHMKTNGILAVNISNRYLDLRPVMERAAARLNKVALAYEYNPGSGDAFCFDSTWVLMMDRSTLEAHPELKEGGQELKSGKPFRMWTDDFSNMYSILK